MSPSERLVVSRSLTQQKYGIFQALPNDGIRFKGSAFLAVESDTQQGELVLFIGATQVRIVYLIEYKTCRISIIVIK